MFQTKIYAISKYNYFTFFYPKPRHLSKKTLYRSNFRQHTVLILAFDLNFLLLDHLDIQRNTSLIHTTTDLLHERHAKLSSNCPSLWGVYGVWFWDGLIPARLQAELFTPIRTTANGLLSKLKKIIVVAGKCFIALDYRVDNQVG